jgi:hypothetical protein
MTRARDLSKLANEQTLTIDTTNTRVGIGSTYPTVRLDLKDGQIKGDGSLLTGVTGLGTAVATSGPGASLYYVNKTLDITEDTTVTVPTTSTSNVAYTNYQEISVDADQDLIIADGDDLMLDVLNLQE